MGYREEFRERINDLWDKALDYTIPERNKIVQSMIDEYRNKTGHNPDPLMLERMADIILADDLKDRSTNKALKDLPITSQSQERRYRKRVLNMEDATLEHVDAINDPIKSDYINWSKKVNHNDME
jgi:hypothetical protein